jgi:Ca2+-binding EF-hand superfamily protein
MKISLSTCALAMAALLAGTAMAGDKSHGAAGMRADADGDGRVSRAEASAAASEKSSAWFDKLDADKDGYVSQEEMKQARDTRREHKRGEMKARMDARFAQTDANSDGQLALDEVQAKNPRLAERFSALDADRNGMLSKDELKRGAPGRPQRKN